MRAVLISDVMDRNLVTVAEVATVREAAELMREHNIGSLIVTDPQKKFVGIVTERDFVKKVLAQGLHPSAVHVHEVLTPRIVSIDAHAPLDEARRLVQRHHIRRLLVKENGRYAGIITSRQLVRHARYEIAAHLAHPERDYILREI